MAKLTRKFLEALGVSENAITAIVEAHSDAMQEVISQRDEAQKIADSVPDLEKQLKTYKDGNFEVKYNNEKAAHDALKNQIATEKAKSAKEAALKAYYEGKNIKGGNLTIAMRGTDLSKIEVDDEGKLKDTKDLDALVEGDYKTLVDTGNRIVDTGAHVGENGGGKVSYDLKSALRDAYKK